MNTGEKSKTKAKFLMVVNLLVAFSPVDSLFFWRGFK